MRDEPAVCDEDVTPKKGVFSFENGAYLWVRVGRYQAPILLVERRQEFSLFIWVGFRGCPWTPPFFLVISKVMGYMAGMRMVEKIRARLTETLEPAHLEVLDESHMHSGPQDAQSHFNVFIVSEAFAGKRAVARHQAVYRALAVEMSGGIHALALKTQTPEEWSEQGGGALTSPQCLGGSKKEG